MSHVTEGDVWPGFLRSIQSKLSQESFNTWFRPLAFDGLDESERLIHLRAPNPDIKNWVNTNYRSLVDESLSAVRLDGYLVWWTIDDTNQDHGGQLRLLADEGEAARRTDAVPRKSPEASPVSTTSVAAPKRALQPPALNPKYTYESFVVGSCNQFAHAASSAVADAPGKTYNPLYIYGGVGLGKTHLMHACGHAIKQRNNHLQLCYISSEKFMNELINAIRYDRTQGFRRRYRSVDVLLIDDVQFMAGKEGAGEE